MPTNGTTSNVNDTHGHIRTDPAAVAAAAQREALRSGGEPARTTR